jgi:general secretion pathway protein D
VGFLAVQFFAHAENEAPGGEEATHREQTRSELLEDVSESWRRSSPQPEREAPGLHGTVESPLARKLESIVLPNVSFTRAEVGHVITALSAISAEFDQTASSAKGVNIVLLDPAATKAPLVTVTLRNVSLKRALDFVTSSIDYHYELQADAVVVRPGGEASVLETEFFPVARATALRMAGGRSAGEGSPTKNGASASPPPVGEAGSEPAAYAAEARAIKGFLQQAGVNFDAVPGASLAYDGSAVIVTQTTPNLERARTILRRYTHVRQVEIEAKFMEVQEGALEELGVNWSVGQKATQHSGAKTTYMTTGRSLASAFSNTIGNQQGRIVRPETATTNADGAITFSTPIDIPIVNNAPSIPGSPSLAAAANPLATISGIVGEFDVNAIVRALSQKQGTDLLSAPKVTVLSGNPATMTVAQEMRYPQSFGQTQSQVGTGSASGGGSAGVAITAGTPQDFTSRNIGVELKVTPTVEEDDYSISLDLNPRVTEFDGFVEYGGPSIAISGGTTVTVPSGFFQPIFSVRDISTKVTIWDGATIVMGGLTREEVKHVNDKVPILGSLPLVGRMFRSKGQSAQKRNLLIFLTANLVSPGGAHAQPNRQRVALTKAARRELLFPTPQTAQEPEVRSRGPQDAEIEKSAR